MAIRFDAVADVLSRNSDLIDFNSPYTMMGWFRLSVDTNESAVFFSLDNSPGNDQDWLATNADGVTLLLLVINGVDTSISGSVLSVDTWYHLALVRESATVLKMYLNGVQDGTTNTRDITGRAAVTFVGCGNAASFYLLNGRAAYLKAWTVGLTAAEIKNEMRTILPKKLASLYAWWPLLSGATERLRDYSGKGRGWTAGGTLTDEAPPNISWGAQAQFVIPVAAAVTTRRYSISTLGVG